MKYKDIDWSKWMDTPSEESYEAWLAVRKAKRSATTQYALNLAAKHANKLIMRGYTATDVLDIAIERSWAGLEWVVKEEAKQGFQRVPLPDNVTPLKTTRDMSIFQ
jgi:hypothetical protein